VNVNIMVSCILRHCSVYQHSEERTASTFRPSDYITCALNIDAVVSAWKLVNSCQYTRCQDPISYSRRLTVHFPWIIPAACLFSQLPSLLLSEEVKRKMPKTIIERAAFVWVW